MKTVAVSLAGLLWAGVAWSQTANELKRWSNGDDGSKIAAIAYVSGVRDAAVAIKHGFGSDPAFMVSEAAKAIPCIPEGVTNGQALEVVKKAMATNPEDLHQHASVFVLRALRGAWKCPGEK